MPMFWSTSNEPGSPRRPDRDNVARRKSRFTDEILSETNRIGPFQIRSPFRFSQTRISRSDSGLNGIWGAFESEPPSLGPRIARFRKEPTDSPMRTHESTDRRAALRTVPTVISTESSSGELCEASRYVKYLWFSHKILTFLATNST